MNLIAKTSYGEVKGTEENGVLVWKGIPYAQQPKRFALPLSSEPWTGIKDAMHYSAICPQERKKKENMSEDCLTLNIWSPSCEENSGEFPVLFFIHGGSFAGGCGSEAAYDGANFAKNENVVVVTCNYRIGILGFLDFSFLDDSLHANCGLHDILAALRWVKQNIGAFGGDATNVTVFGQSAGGTATSTLATLPAARGLFEKCIVMSGGPTLLQSREEGMQTARAFLKWANISDAKALLNIPEQALSTLQKEFVAWYGLGVGTFRISAGTELVPDYPIPAVKNGAAKGIPMLMGTTREEMSFLLVKPLARTWGIGDMMGKGAEQEAPENRERIVNTYRSLYGTKRGKAIMYSDMLFRMGNIWYAQEYSKYANIWMYRFDYETAAMKISALHAFHSSDIPFVFGNFKEGIGKLIFLLSPSMKKIQALSREMQHDFATFARTGKVEWKACSAQEAPAKCYGETCSISPAVEEDISAQYEHTKFKQRCFWSCRAE